MTKQKYVYLVFPANGKSATEHQATRAAVEPSGALALYGEGDELIQAFAAGSWQSMSRQVRER